MEKKVKAPARSNKAGKAEKGFVSFLLRGVLTGIIIFTLCVLLMPLLLMRTDDPGAFISAVSVGIMALTAFFCAFSASKGSSKHFIFTGVICALILCVVLTAVSLLFSGKETETDLIFSVIVYAVTCVFSLFGSALGGKKVGSKKRRKHRR